MSDIGINCIAGTNCIVGEGPLWDDNREELYWVDILDNKIYRMNPEDGEVEWWRTPEYIGFIVLTAGNSLVAGLKSGLHYVWLEDNNRVSVSRIDRVDEKYDQIRFNDGICDHRGLLWGCTMDMEQQSPMGKFYCYDSQLNRVVVDEGYIVANGPAVSPDGQQLYMVESAGNGSIKKGIYVAKISGNKLSGAKQLLIDWKDYASAPDGITVDNRGNLWVGEFGGNVLRCYSEDGQLIEEVALPAWNITKPAIGGASLDTIYVTSARIATDNQIIEKYPCTGGVVEIKGLKVKGIASARFPLGNN